MADDRPNLLPDITQRLRDFDFAGLFHELGWDRHRDRFPVDLDGTVWALDGVAEKRGFQVFRVRPGRDGAIPPRALRRRIDREVTKRAQEHLLIFTDDQLRRQVWQWTRREPGRPLQAHEQEVLLHDRGERVNDLAQRLNRLYVSIDEETDLGITDVAGRVRGSFEAERVTRRFYDRFQQEHQAFLGQISGIAAEGDRTWYASLTLNRLMFVYFIQKKGFLDHDPDYLRHGMERVRRAKGPGHFLDFYRAFLLRLFHDGLSKPPADRPGDVAALLGTVPYLNGGLFDVHPLEQANPGIAIPDDAFAALFDFFDAYRWHLDERPLRADDEINPDVLGHIFEKHVNQKQMGAYYTKEDITEYIGKNTVLPALLDLAREQCAVAFQPGGSAWALLRDDPDRYVYPAVRHGADRPLPPGIAAGTDDVAARGDWNRPAAEEIGLPTETWREAVARRQRCAELRARLAAGEVASVDDMVTLNLDIRQFAQDVVADCGEDALRALWQAVRRVTVLDPTCGSGAFLFAALNILQPLYEGCLDRMQAFVDEHERAGRPGSPQRFADFRQTLADVAKHPNRDYYALKQIILSNLYGVDIMEEAVEICKLRLFLKLAAQLDDPGRIEPLPDIDFNVRAGNTLVGYATYADVERALAGKGALQARMDLGGKMARVEEAAKKLDLATARFRALQGEQEVDAAGQREAKGQVRERLAALRDELDRALATDYDVRPDDPGGAARLAAWRASHQPFHWFIEFHAIVHERGGFDAIVGNPPYVSVRKIDYRFPRLSQRKYSDIYAHVLERCMDLTKARGRLALIVPLSITFSEDYGELREKICDFGRTWFSSFDILPSPLFSGVAQRCTILIGKSCSEADVATSRLHRWRSISRPFLFSQVGYVHSESTASDVRYGGVPRHGTLTSVNALAAINRQQMMPKIRDLDAHGPKAPTRMMHAQTALNFVSVFLSPPPLLRDSDFAELLLERQAEIQVGNEDVARAGLAITVGEFYLWYWLTRGDGFHVTKWIMRDFLQVLEAVSASDFILLSRIGGLLDLRKSEALVFKHHASKYVGNYNYRSLAFLTRRADLLLMSALGLNKEQCLDLLDWVVRTLSVNALAGEKATPDRLKPRYPMAVVNQDWQAEVLAEVDAVLKQRLGFADDELAFVMNRDWLGLSWGSADMAN